MVPGTSFQNFLASELRRHENVAVYAGLTGKDILDEFAKKSSFGENFLRVFANAFFAGLCPSKKSRCIPLADLQSGAWIDTLIQDAEESYSPNFKFRCLCLEPHPPYVEGLKTFDSFSWEMPNRFLGVTLEKIKQETYSH